MIPTFDNAPKEHCFACTLSTTGIAKFTETHCSKECAWLVYGRVNIIPTNQIGVCCACREVLELDYKNNEFKRLKLCIAEGGKA